MIKRGRGSCFPLSEEFISKWLITKAKDLVPNFLSCVLSQSGSKILITISSTFHVSRPNKALYSNQLYLGNGESGNRYRLVVNDEFSRYASLSATTSSSATHAAAVFARRQQTFTAQIYWVSDPGAHFINSMLAAMAQNFNIQH